MLDKNYSQPSANKINYKKNSSDFYNEKYFNDYIKTAELGMKLNVPLFSPYIADTDTVLDFGCASGHLLKYLNCKEKLGIEVNPVAAKYAKNINNITVFDSIDTTPDNCADIIISNHVLEHTLRPYDDILKLKNKLKPNGKVIFIVPCEPINRKFQKNDTNHHLYTWSPMNLGNLFIEAQYVIEECKRLRYFWRKEHLILAERFPDKIKMLEFLCKMYSYMDLRLSQVMLIARK